MKPFIFTFITLLCAYGQDASAQHLRIGHRNVNQVAVLDISSAYIEPIIIQELTLHNFTNIKVTKLDISDNAFNPEYYASIGITIECQEKGSPDVLKLSFLYPIVYDASMNAYYGGKPNFGDIQDGGSSSDSNPDNNFCVARNCVGCATMRDQNGKTLGCTFCQPTNPNPDVSYSCVVENSSGTGIGRLLTGLSGLLKGLIGLF